MNAIVRIVQLSDCHVFKDGNKTLLGLSTHDSFTRVIQMLAQDTFKPDMILLTGDLSQDASEGAYKYIVGALQIFTCPIYWIAGNHDNLTTMQQAFAGALKPDKSIITLNNWQVILLNTLDPGKVSGWLDQGELQHLTTCLSNPHYKHAMIALHHHPVPIGCGWLEPLGLKNANTLFEIAAKENRIRVIAWGHIHQVFEGEQQGIKFFSAPSTSIQFLPHSNNFTLDTQRTPGISLF